MGITLRRAGFLVAEQRPDDWQAHAAARAQRGEAVAEVMQPHIAQPGPLAHQHPWPFEVHDMPARRAARENMRITRDAGQGGQHRQRRRVERDCLLARLGVGQVRL